MLPSLAIVLAALMGACGVGLAAVASHAAQGTGLASAADMLLFHGLAVLAAVALLVDGRLWRPAAILALAGWITGSALFAGDIALRALAGHRLFAMAAPTGGSILIASWLAMAVAAAVAKR